MSGTVNKAKLERHPLSEVLSYTNVRPKAVTVSSFAEIDANRSDLVSQDTKYFASLKYDGYAAIWTGTGLITKDGNAKYCFVPKTLEEELTKTFSNEILLGEFVLVHDEQSTYKYFKSKDNEIFGKKYLSAAVNKPFQPPSATKAQTKVNNRCIFMVYDIISYKHRNSPFSERYRVLQKFFKNQQFVRLKLIEQYGLPEFSQRSVPNATKPEWESLYAKLPPTIRAGLFQQKDELCVAGEILNLMSLGCICGNHEGIIITPDVPYYDLFEKQKQRIKIKPRSRFAVSVPATKKDKNWYTTGEAKESQKVLGTLKIPMHIMISKKASGNAQALRKQLFDDDVKLERTFNLIGRVPKETTSKTYRSVVNTYNQSGLQVEFNPAPIEPRSIIELLPPGIGMYAKWFYDSVVYSNGLFATEVELKKELTRTGENWQVIEAIRLMQIGNNVRPFQAGDALVVLKNEKYEALVNDGQTSFALSPSFKDEPDNVSMMAMLLQLPVGDKGYNGSVPSLKRFFEGKEDTWNETYTSLKKEYPVFVECTANLQHLPLNVQFFTRASKYSRVFNNVDRPESESGQEVFINIMQNGARDVVSASEPVRSVYEPCLLEKNEEIVQAFASVDNSKKQVAKENGAILTRPQLANTNPAFKEENDSEGFGVYDKTDTNGQPLNAAEIFLFLKLKNIMRGMEEEAAEKFGHLSLVV